MITSTSIKIHPKTGCIDILINTEDKWVDYQVNRLTEAHKIEISFYITDITLYSEEIGYKKELIEYIAMKEDFNSINYMIYHFQEKDQITLFLVPRKLLLDRTQWDKYKIN